MALRYIVWVTKGDGVGSLPAVGNGDHLPLAPVPAGSCFGGLDERIGSFEQAVADATCMPGDDPVPVFFDGLDKLLQRLESRTLCAVAPVAEIRLGSLLW